MATRTFRALLVFSCFFALTSTATAFTGTKNGLYATWSKPSLKNPPPDDAHGNPTPGAIFKLDRTGKKLAAAGFWVSFTCTSDDGGYKHNGSLPVRASKIAQTAAGFRYSHANYRVRGKFLSPRSVRLTVSLPVRKLEHVDGSDTCVRTSTWETHTWTAKLVGTGPMMKMAG